MRINAINNIKFNGKMGYDDEISSKRRNKIRERINQDCLYNVDIFEKNIRLEEYEFNKLVNGLTKAQNQTMQNREENEIDGDILKEAGLVMVGAITGKLYKAGTMGLTKEQYQKIKKAGVKRVISLHGGYFNEKELNKLGIKTSSYFGDRNIWDDEAFKTAEDVTREANDNFDGFVKWGDNTENEREAYILDELNIWNNNKRDFINQFVNFIRDMQEENVLIGCAFGTDRTSEMLMLDYFFNPKGENSASYSRIPDAEDLVHMKNLYNNLTPEDKEKMGWDEEFDDDFINKLR